MELNRTQNRVAPKLKVFIPGERESVIRSQTLNCNENRKIVDLSTEQLAAVVGSADVVIEP